MSLGRLSRRPVLAGGLFIGGVIASVNVLGQSADIPDLGQYLGLALQAVVGLIGLLGPVLMFQRQLLAKREKLARGDVVKEIKHLRRWARDIGARVDVPEPPRLSDEDEEALEILNHAGGDE